jgi:hypothetical protein
MQNSMSSQRRRNQSDLVVGLCTRCPDNRVGRGLALAIALPLLGGTPAIAATLTNGTGDGQVSINVDGYGAFGADTFFNPTGPFGPTSVVTNSSLAIRFGSSGPRTFLSTGAIGTSGSLPVLSQTGNATESRSSFVFGNLNFSLVQTVASGVINPSITGSRLTQTYSITNPTPTAISFDLLRYLDGALPFDSDARSDGGAVGTRVGTGRMTLLETDVAGSPLDAFNGLGVSLASSGFWCNFPKLSISLICNDVKCAIRALTDITNPLSALCQQMFFTRYAIVFNN